MIVVDTNVIAYLILPGRRSPHAEAAFAKDRNWVAPPLWRSEFRNVLSLAIRQGSFSLAQGFRFAHEAEELMEGREVDVSTPAVLELASGSGCSAYDCEFVALAQDLRVRLVTVDRQVLAAFPSTAIALEEFAP